jgi:hypothetical protein
MKVTILTSKQDVKRTGGDAFGYLQEALCGGARVGHNPGHRNKRTFEMN